MENLFDTATYTNILQRINKLKPDQPAQWGKMNVAQMLAHCCEPFKIPLSDKPLPRMFIGRILGALFKSKLYNEDPWKHSTPTSPAFIIKDQRDFEKEKKNLIEIINKYYAAGPMGISKHPHPFFGKMTPEQSGKSMYKHLDHHLRQFGV